LQFGDPAVVLVFMRVKESNFLPSSEALAFYRKGTSLKTRIDEVNEAIKGQLRLLTSLVNPKRGPVEVTSSHNIRYDDVIDYLDDIGENIGLSLDKSKTKTKELAAPIGSRRNLHVDITNQDVITRDDDSRKPQLYFEPAPDNSEVGFG
jgi:hypothetical protein